MTTTTKQPTFNRGTMGDLSLTLLRHCEVHGPQTTEEITKAPHGAPRQTVLKSIYNLVQHGHLFRDKTTKEPTLRLTGQGRARLAPPVTTAHHPQPTNWERPAASARNGTLPKALQRKLQHTLTRLAGTYTPEPFTDHARAGASDHEALPSRYGDRLHWRDGRITNLAGTLLLDAAGQPITTAAPADYRPLTRSLYAS